LTTLSFQTKFSLHTDELCLPPVGGGDVTLFFKMHYISCTRYVFCKGNFLIGGIYVGFKTHFRKERNSGFRGQPPY